MQMLSVLERMLGKHREMRHLAMRLNTGLTRARTNCAGITPLWSREARPWLRARHHTPTPGRSRYSA
jgi:hypothetical protein